MCDVPSIAVFCSEYIECFPVTPSKFFLTLLVTIPVAPIITGIIVHFRFHIRCISIHKHLYFNVFSVYYYYYYYYYLSCTQGIFNYVPETSRVSSAYSFVIIIITTIIIWIDRYMGRERQIDSRQTNRKGSRNSQELSCSLHFLCHDSCRICINQLWPEFQNIPLDVIKGNDPISCQLKLGRNLETFCCAT